MTTAPILEATPLEAVVGNWLGNSVRRDYFFLFTSGANMLAWIEGWNGGNKAKAGLASGRDFGRLTRNRRVIGWLQYTLSSR
jgi:hypothetical protein